MTRVAIFGDSIAWGSWDPEGGGWTTRLRLDYMRRPSPADEPDEYVSVHTCAVPGHRAGDIVQRIESDLRAIEPDVVVVAVGINDSPGDGGSVTDPAEFARDYGFVLDSALSATPRVLALSTTNVNPAVRPDQDARLPAHNRRMADLCAARGVPVIEVYGLLDDVDLVADGLHPNASGHLKIQGSVLAALDRAGVGVAA